MIKRAFQDVVGHQRQQHYFYEQLANNQVAHAYCFKGAAGIGKHFFAKALIREMMCAGRPDDYVKFDTANHPDYLAIVSGGAILTEQVNALREFIYKKPLIAGRKAVLFDDAANMNEQAQNKLLKILEEPPGSTLLILITNRPSGLLPTIASRLTQISFNPLDQQQMKTLIKRHGLAFDEFLLGVSAGSFGSYLQFQSNQQFAERSRATIAMLVSVATKRSNQWLLDIGLLEQYKEDSAALFYLLRLVLRDLLIYAQSNTTEQLRLLKPFDLQNIDNNTIKVAPIYGMIREINRAEVALARGQNYSLVTERLLFNIEEALNG